MHESNLQLAGGDQNVGTIYLPEEQAVSLPVLILCLSGATHREPYRLTAELCARGLEAGLAVVTFDFYSWGETPGDPRLGTYGRWASNLSDICAYVRTQEWADAGRIIALGISAGSTAVLRCAIDTSHLAAGIAVATFLGHYVGMPDGPAKLLADHLDVLLAGGTADLVDRDGSRLPCDLDFLKDAVGGAPIYRLHTVSCPIFFLQGAADNVFRRSDARLGYELLRSHALPTAYHEIEDGDHVLGNVAQDATRLILAWLRECALLRP